MCQDLSRGIANAFSVHPQRLLIDFPFLDIDSVVTRCQQLYFPTENYTIATFITVNCYLLNLLRDVSPEVSEKNGLQRQDLLQYSDLCVTNVTTAAKCWGIGMEASLDNMQALLLTVSVLRRLKVTS